jgi:hypothetical protein
MAKQKTQIRPEARHLIPKKYQHYVAVGVILLALVLFFRDEIFSGKVFNAGDNIASQSFLPFLDDAKKDGVFPMWVPYIFCGMPSFASLLATPERTYDISNTFVNWGHDIFTFFLRNPDVTSVLFYYFVFGISTYFFMIHKKKTPLVALFTSLSTIFSMYVIILIMVGHNTKVASICLLPIVLMIVEEMIDDFKWWHGIVLMLAIHIQQLASHIQFFFYSYLLIGIYYLYLLIVRIVKKEQWLVVLRSGIVFAIAAAFSFAMSADIYLSTLEYNPYSIRGSNPIVKSAPELQSKTTEGGLDYEYATSWSFSPGEVMTFFIPSFYGFGDQPYKGPLTGNQETSINTYWGQMPWTDGPQYMGVVVLILASLGVYYNRKDRFVQATLIVCLLALFVSFGKTFSLVYDLMYNYFPMFNKFRIPSMVLILPQIIMPILGGFGLQSLIDKGKDKFAPETQKKFRYIIGGAGVLFVLGFIARGFFEDMYKGFMGNDEVRKLIIGRFGNQPDNVIAQVRPMLFDFVFNSVMTDYLVATFLLLAIFGLTYAYRKSMITSTTLALATIILSLFDLWRVDSKPMRMHDKNTKAATFATPDYVKAIKSDQSLYRVLDTQNLGGGVSNNLAYFRIQSIGGYHGAKLRVYQDVVDVATIGNPVVWVLMNTKYIIADPKENVPNLAVVFQGQDKKVLAYPPGSERAWFVDSIAVDSGLGILTRMRDMTFDPHHVAFFEKNPGVVVQRPDTSARVALKNFGIHGISFDVEASGNNLLFVSEIYYPKGWNAYVDGKQTEIFKTNYAFRSIVVPKGNHVVEFKFEPTRYYIGRIVSLATNVFAWCSLLVVGFLWWKKQRKSAA